MFSSEKCSKTFYCLICCIYKIFAFIDAVNKPSTVLQHSRLSSYQTFDLCSLNLCFKFFKKLRPFYVVVRRNSLKSTKEKWSPWLLFSLSTRTLSTFQTETMIWLCWTWYKLLSLFSLLYLLDCLVKHFGIPWVRKYIMEDGN